MAITFKSVLAAARAILQTKTVTAGTSAKTVEPDSGYNGLSSVTVNPTPSQSKSATPTTSVQTITPDSGKLLSSVSVGAIQTQTKSATPTTSAQTISPDSGKLLSQVDIAPIPSQYKIPTQIMPGNTPGAMTAGEAYSPVSNAYIIKEYREIYPNDAYPAAIYTEMLDAKDTGYAIRSYSSASKTPSPTGEYFASGWNRMTSAGYAYSSQPAINYPFAFAVISATGSIEIQGHTENRAAVACITDTYGRCRLGAGSTTTTDGTYASIQTGTVKNGTTRTRKITIKIAGRYLKRSIVTSGTATETIETYTAGQEITATDGVWFYIGA